MFYLVYVSLAADDISKQDLLDILEESRPRNSHAGITGMLLYKDGNFMQVLEGEEPSVKELYERVRRDSRHRGVLTLAEGQRQRRQFGDWSMGFRDLNDPEVRSTPGYSEFLNTPLTAESFTRDPAQCERLLWVFKGEESP